IQLKSGRLIVFYNPRPIQQSPEKKFGISCKISDDNGKSWSAEKVLYKADWQFDNGCWEPSAVQMPNGEIQLFFANESDYRKSNDQNISMLRSVNNGDSWTKEREIASFSKGSRDGMPVPILLKNQEEIVFAIEDNIDGNFKPDIIRNSLSNNWSEIVNQGSLNRSYALVEKLEREIYAGAPYLRQLRSGETILSYQGTEGRINDMKHADMKVVIGDANARSFVAKSIPFVIPADKSCLWNSLAVLDDDTIIAVTSTNAFSDRSEIWMIKGHLVSDEQDSRKPILMADPTVFLDNGTYYLYGTSSNKGFQTYVSKDLEHWSEPKGVKDFRSILSDKDLDAMYLAPPDHWHAPAAIICCTANKHVYVEKPLCHNPHEGELAVAAARKYKRVVQMGSQRRSWPTLTEGIHALHNGAIGKVYMAKTWYTNNRATIGVGKTVPVPSNLDFELWQGPAPRMPYKDNLVHYNWHWFWHWGTGEALNNGTHEIDVARWGLQADYPTKVNSVGGRYRFQDDWETPDTQIITFECKDASV
ncbi:MAG: hypothetical protein EOO88_44420, partial [Pedobacter sp.]